MEQFPVRRSDDVPALLEELYAMTDREVAHVLCNITMSNHIENDYLAGMARRFHNPGQFPLVYLEDARQMIDALLEHYDVERGGNQMVVGLLRGTFIARKELPQWIPCRNRIHEHLVKTEGLKFADRVLRGLMKDEQL